MSSLSHISTPTTNMIEFSNTVNLFSFLFAYVTVLAIASGNHVNSSSIASQDFEDHTETFRQISRDNFSCKSSDVVVRTICRIVLARVDPELKKGISIDKNGVLYDFNKAGITPIPTGSSCRVRAEIRHINVLARFNQIHQLRFSFKSLSSSHAIALELPVNVNAKVDARQYFGFKLFKCRTIGRDSFRFLGDLSTMADLLLAFTLNPKLTQERDGNYKLTLAPAAVVLFKVRNMHLLRFRASGVSPITPVLNAIRVLPSSIANSVTSLVKSGRIKNFVNHIKEGLVYHIGSIFVLGVGALPRPAEKLIFSLFHNIAARELEKKVNGMKQDIENDLNKKIRNALNAHVNGKRIFTIKKDFLDLVKQFGDSADIFVPQKQKAISSPKNRAYNTRRERLLPPNRNFHQKLVPVV